MNTFLTPDASSYTPFTPVVKTAALEEAIEGWSSAKSTRRNRICDSHPALEVGESLLPACGGDHRGPLRSQRFGRRLAYTARSPRNDRDLAGHVSYLFPCRVYIMSARYADVEEKPPYDPEPLLERARVVRRFRVLVY